jgi:uncharacterized repeat protein (TIGR01451 family)
VRRLVLALAAVAATIAGAAPAGAACSTANTYTYSFNWGANASLSYANSYSYAASNGLGATRNFTLSFATDGLVSNVVNNVALPAVSTTISGQSGGRTLVVGGEFSGRTADVALTTRVIRVVLTFATPVRDIAINVHDIDYANKQFRDWLMVQGSDGTSSYTPTLATPFGSNNGAGPRTATGSTVALGVYNQGGVSLTSSQGAGLTASANTGTNAGDINISFPQPVTTVTLRYGNYPGESQTGPQAYGISTISFCPMPVIQTAKSSAPWATTGEGRFNAPGSDVVYTLTVTNNGGSPVDLNGLVLVDALPSTVRFYNGDFDPSAPGTEPFQLTAGTSGITLSSSNVGYSNNNGATYSYTPAAGYDANVNRVRFAPAGTMAANSSFTVKFRAQIK